MNNLKWRIAPLVALGFGLASTAAAAGPRATPHNTSQVAGGAHAMNKGQSNTAAHANMVAALHQAHKLLATADHDYKGHRAKAEADIGHAIRELTAHHNGGQHGAVGGANKGAGGQGAAAAVKKAQAGNGGQAAGNGNAPRIPQAQSDAQLKQALQLLTGIHGQLPGGHKAAAHVHAAINELNTALQVR